VPPARRAGVHTPFSCLGEPESVGPPVGRNHASAEQREAPCRSSPQDQHTHHEVVARTGVPTNRSSFVGWPSAVGPSGRTNLLNSFTLEGRLLRTGKRILRLKRLHGRPWTGLRTTLHMGRLLARCLKLLRLSTQSANLDCTCFRNKITHIEILSRSVELCPPKLQQPSPTALPDQKTPNKIPSDPHSAPQPLK